MTWAAQEMASLSTGDQRLDQRSIRVLKSLCDAPSASITQAGGSAAEVKAAYRLLSNKKVTAQTLLQPHWAQTQQRMKQCQTVLCLQDTTELDFNKRKTKGLGRLSYDAQRGMYLHSTLVVDTQRVPLGVLDAWTWARKDKGEANIKESLRWIEGYERIAECAQELANTQVVYVADREADISALFQRAESLNFAADVLVRMTHNRALEGGKKLFDTLACAPVVAQVEFTLPKGRGRKSRKVQQALRACPVKICPKTGGIQLWALEARETNAPVGVKPIVWRLLSNIAISDASVAVQLIDWYRARWEIEMFFNVLKTGFEIEALQLGRIERIENALALYLICAWRVHYMMRLGRAKPELNCQLLLEPMEWKMAYRLNRKKPPSKVPTLAVVMKLIAQIGGFMGRKGDGDPGAKTIWLGWESLNIAVLAVTLEADD